MLKMTELIKNQGKINMLLFEDEVVIKQNESSFTPSLKEAPSVELKSAATAANHPSHSGRVNASDKREERSGLATTTVEQVECIFIPQ